MMRKDDARFKKLVDATLARVMTSGEAETIYAKWFQPRSAQGPQPGLPALGRHAKLYQSPDDQAPRLGPTAAGAAVPYQLELGGLPQPGPLGRRHLPRLAALRAAGHGGAVAGGLAPGARPGHRWWACCARCRAGCCPALAAAYVEVFRNVPLLVQLFIWYFVVPELLPRGRRRHQADPTR